MTRSQRTGATSPGVRPHVATLAEVRAERVRQDAKWGEQNHPDGTGPRYGYDVAAADFARNLCDVAHRDGRGTWAQILHEEFAEAMACDDVGDLRYELVQVAAVAVAWVEAIDRRGAS